MEKRIRGMYKDTHTGLSGKITAVFIAILILTVSLLTACQPTPETPPIVNKADNNLEKMIESSAQSPAASSTQSSNPSAQSDVIKKAVGAPESFKDSYTNKKGDVTVSIDAKVDVPMVEKIPAVQVKPSGFSQEIVDKFAAYFLKGAPVFTNVKDLPTKPKLQQQILEAKASLAESQQKLKSETDKNRIQMYEEDVKSYEGYIKNLEKEYEKAPETVKSEPATTQLKKNKSESFLEVIADLGKDDQALFRVSNDGQYNSFYFLNDGKGNYNAEFAAKFNIDAVPSDKPRGMKTTREEAEKLLWQCLAEFGIENMQIGSVSASTFFKDDNSYNDKDYIANANQCFAFTLVKTVGGVPVTDIQASVRMDTDDPSVPAAKEPEYKNVMRSEALSVLIDDTGIVEFNWRQPDEQVSVLSENVTLKKFDEIVQKAKDNIFYKNYTAYNSKANIKITRIKLGMMRIMRQDKPGEYLIVPVWDFIGNHAHVDEKGNSHELPFGYQSYATVNAIDGSFINRDWGY